MCDWSVVDDQSARVNESKEELLVRDVSDMSVGNLAEDDIYAAGSNRKGDHEFDADQGLQRSNTILDGDFADKPTYSKMIAHKNLVHPRIDGKKFGCCASLGYYPICCCKQQPISKMAKEIGVGPTIFLMSTARLGWFFVLLSILNIPLYLFFYTSN